MIEILKSKGLALTPHFSVPYVLIYILIFICFDILKHWFNHVLFFSDVQQSVSRQHLIWQNIGHVTKFYHSTIIFFREFSKLRK